MIDLNPMPDPLPTGWVAKVILAILGGTANLAYKRLTGARVTFLHFILRAIVSLFIGVVCYHIMPQNSEVGFAATGLISWMGADGISLLIELWKGKDKK